jgi:hypothetical protein
MLALTLFAVFLVIWTAPDTLIGKALRRALVEWPAARLSRLTARRMLGLVTLAAGLAVAFWLLDRELLLVASMAMPEAVGWLATFEISTLVDALAAIALASAHLRLRGAAGRVRAALGALRARLGARNRDRRARRTEVRKADNDDADGPAFAYAMAA